MSFDRSGVSDISVSVLKNSYKKLASILTMGFDQSKAVRRHFIIFFVLIVLNGQ